MPKVKFVAQDFMGMVANLPAVKVDTLYESHWTCQAIFRSLPPIAKMYVLRLLYIDTAVKSKLMDEWILPEYHTKHRVAMDRLEQLRVLLLASEGSKEQSYRLNPKFQKQLQQALTSGGAPPKDPLPSSIAVRLPSSAELDSYAMKQWEGVLLQLVSTAFPESSQDFSRDRFVIETFQRAKLLDSGMKLTEAGFQFLLMDTSYQLWQIVREYISTAEDRGINNVELIRFLLELGFHVVGQPYNRDTLLSTEQTVLEELKVLGLVQLQQGMKHRWFIPTKLATNLATSLSDVAGRYQSEGFIILETNFRLYAYTSSKLQIQILRLFARIEYLLPNLTVGTLNRESIQTAFASGISAEQLLGLCFSGNPCVEACLRKKKGKKRLFPKLSMRYYGPFQITERINNVSFRLRLPDTWKIHNAFHVSLLKPFRGDVPDDGEPDEQPEVEENEEILVPEQILAHKDTKTKGKVRRRFLGKFKNYPALDAKWMEEDLADTPQIVNLYLEAFGLA
ncbi:hypothetical protein L7F22_000994 [Adiantum nelumboides]|nr:hypothetical protein [Adiantum nelumboides]